MDKLYSNINNAFTALQEALEKQAIQATLKLSKSERNKDTNCGFICAMGCWFWWTDNESRVSPSANKSWQKAFDQYGYNFMIRSLKIICRNGKIIEKSRNW